MARTSRREQVWRELADRIGGAFLTKRGDRPMTVQRRAPDWIVTLDEMPAERGGVGIRLRAPFANPSGFRFLVYTAGFFSELAKRLVLLQDLLVGHAGIDRRHVVQSTRPDRVRDLFRHEAVRNGIWAQIAKIRFGVAHYDSAFQVPYPDGLDCLFFETPADLNDVDRLAQLFLLMDAALRDLTGIDEHEDDVDRQIYRLQGPGGIITGRVTLWEGEPVRHDAADALARYADPRAAGPLVRALADPDVVLQSKAVFALGEIGDARVVKLIVPMLGRRKDTLKRSLAEEASEALRKLGQEELVDAFLAALEGDAERLPRAAQEFRMEVIRALLLALEGPGRLSVAHAVKALERMGAVEALPELRAGLKRRRQRDVKDAYRSAIAALEARTSLPKPAGPAPTARDRLPRPASADAPLSTRTLPRAPEGGSEGVDSGP